MVAYKLHYFEGLGGRVELTRLLLAYGGVAYEQVNIPLADWPNQKPNYPNGQVPILEVDGKVLTQSIAIARYFAKKLDLLGGDDWEAAETDSFVGIIEDTIQAMKTNDLIMKIVTGKGAEVAGETVQTLTPFLERLEKHLKTTNGVNLVDNKLTWADFAIADLFKRYSLTAPQLLDAFPAVKKFVEHFHALPQLQEYLAKRNIQLF